MDSTTNSTMKVMSPGINLAEKKVTRKRLIRGLPMEQHDHPVVEKVRIKAICEFLLASVEKEGKRKSLRKKNNYKLYLFSASKIIFFILLFLIIYMHVRLFVEFSYPLVAFCTHSCWV